MLLLDPFDQKSLLKFRRIPTFEDGLAGACCETVCLERSTSKARLQGRKQPKVTRRQFWTIWSVRNNFDFIFLEQRLTYCTKFTVNKRTTRNATYYILLLCNAIRLKFFLRTVGTSYFTTMMLFRQKSVLPRRQHVNTHFGGLDSVLETYLVRASYLSQRLHFYYIYVKNYGLHIYKVAFFLEFFPQKCGTSTDHFDSTYVPQPRWPD